MSMTSKARFFGAAAPSRSSSGHSGEAAGRIGPLPLWPPLPSRRMCHQSVTRASLPQVSNASAHSSPHLLAR